jgi:hypothetical protein
VSAGPTAGDPVGVLGFPVLMSQVLSPGLSTVAFSAGGVRWGGAPLRGGLEVEGGIVYVGIGRKRKKGDKINRLFSR